MKAAPAALGVAAILLLGGFEREYGGNGGTCVFWNTRAPGYSVNQNGSTHLTGNDQFNAVAAAFAEWAAPTCTDMKPVDQGLTPRFDITYNPDAGASTPNVNVLVWRPKLCSAVVPDGGTCNQSTSCDDAFDCLDDGDQEAIAVTTFFSRSDTGELLGAGIELNDAKYVFTTVDSPACNQACVDGGVDAGPCQNPPPPASAVNWTCVQFDVQDVVAHEAGHFLGFANALDAGFVMSPIEPAGDLSKRTLGQDDSEAVCTIYPVGEPTPTVCDAGPTLPGPSCGCGAVPSSRGGGSGAGAFALMALVIAGLAWGIRRRRTS